MDPRDVSSNALFDHRQLLQLTKQQREDAYFVDYIPPARDTISLPPNVVYIVIGVVLVLVATYAIVGHLIKDLMHDLADWLFGPKPVEDDLEVGHIEEERHMSVSSKMTNNSTVWMGNDMPGALPGFYYEDGVLQHPLNPGLPLKSAMASYPPTKRASIHSVSFAVPSSPFATSL
ncbi:hypothetical protein WMY93_001447 [Mugilogobius chulae]|uniref:Uncharacterized protein n=1 Tax=Mugilogobius chulae TaxID=88201 RepID=A0AAW0Q826_9GOBI